MAGISLPELANIITPSWVCCPGTWHKNPSPHHRNCWSRASALDELRDEFGFAVILEHHQPKAQNGARREMAPIGSSLWMRWPEFGVGLDVDVDAYANGVRRAKLRHWRGQRSVRPWPYQLEGGKPGELPWVVTNGRPVEMNTSVGRKDIYG